MLCKLDGTEEMKQPDMSGRDKRDECGGHDLPYRHVQLRGETDPMRPGLPIPVGVVWGEL